MQFDVSVFLRHIEDITAAVHKLNEEAELLSRNIIVLQQQARCPLDTLCSATATLVIIRNAMDMLANDREGVKNLAPWQRELFTKAYGHIAGVVETLHEAHEELRLAVDGRA
ncbi:MAG: hypothetical protein DELT_02914 [Desulfovibrio sp.]